MESKVILIALVVTSIGCQFQKPVNSYPFYDITVDRIPPLEKVKGILVMASSHPSVPFYVLVVGDRAEIEQTIGFEIVGYPDPPVKFKSDSAWIKKLYTDCVEAERELELDNYWCGDGGRVTFITDKAAYMIRLCAGNDFQTFPGYRCPKLEKHFKELGIEPD